MNAQETLVVKGFHSRYSAALALGALSALLSVSALPAETLTLRDGDGRMSLTLERTERGASLAELRDHRARRNVIRPGAPLWTIALRDSSGRETVLSSREAGAPSVEHSASGKMILSWVLDRTLDPAAGGLVTVALSIAVDDDEARLRLRVHNLSRQWALREVSFPRLELPALGDSDADDVFVFPCAQGKIIEQPLRKGVNFGGVLENLSQLMGLYPNQWTTMQFCAWYDRAGGLYYAAEDPNAAAKYLRARTAEDRSRMTLETVWPAEDLGVPGSDFDHSGACVLRFFDGDWFDAAKMYRSWARENAPWWPALGDRGRIDTPDWLKENVVWVLGEFSPELPERCIKLQQYLGVPLAVHLYRWHQIPFDVAYPHYLPPKAGFAEVVKKLQAAGIKVVPYINGRLWDSGTEEFDVVARPGATKRENGDLYIELYGTPAKNTPMCPASTVWQNTVRDMVLTLVGPKIGVDGVYLDQVAAMSPVLCFDPSHGHPLGGGHWWLSRGYWPMLGNLRQTLREQYPQAVLLTENNADPYLNCFDAFLNWTYQYNAPAPLHPAVYGGAIQGYGRYFSGKPKLNQLKIAQMLVYGDQLGWMGPEIIDEKDTAGFLKEACRFRAGLLPFLSWGEMARIPEVSGKIPTLPVTWIVTKGDTAVPESGLQKGAWRASDGRTVFLFANVLDEEISFEWSFDPSRYGYGKAGAVVTDFAGGEGSITAKGAKRIPVRLGAREIRAFIASSGK